MDLEHYRSKNKTILNQQIMRRLLSYVFTPGASGVVDLDPALVGKGHVLPGRVQKSDSNGPPTDGDEESVRHCPPVPLFLTNQFFYSLVLKGLS